MPGVGALPFFRDLLRELFYCGCSYVAKGPLARQRGIRPLEPKAGKPPYAAKAMAIRPGGVLEVWRPEIQAREIVFLVLSFLIYPQGRREMGQTAFETALNEPKQYIYFYCHFFAGQVMHDTGGLCRIFVS